MIKNYRRKETVQALFWTGKNKEEVEDFLGGPQNIIWNLSTTKPPEPDFLITNYRGPKPLKENGYLVNENETIIYYSIDEFQKNFEEI